jgi:5-methylthioadenosine/S-adenosylhomocysteine deaminase
MLRSSLTSLLLAAAAIAAEPADWILSARYVVTMDGQRRVIENGAIAIRGDRITAVGTRAEIDSRFTAGQRIDASDAVLVPGLINTHTHAPMVLMRGIADDLTLQEWLEKYIFPAEGKSVSPEFVRDGTQLACMEMLLSGTTTYADMYYFEETIAEATRACGMRGVLGQTIIGFPVPDAKTPAEALGRTEAFIQKFRQDALIVPAVAPHALYTNSEETLRASRALANKYAVPLLIHLAETRKESEDTLAKFKATPTAMLERWGVFEGRTLAAHAVWIDDADTAILKRHGVGIAHCPSSNMKLASGIAPVTRYLAQDMAVGLGTDGPAGSNNDLNAWEEIDLAAKLQKVHTGSPTAVSALQAFEMATIRGARALGMEKEIGSLEEGKRADLAFIRITEPHAQPLFNVYSTLVYAVKASDVRHVMVNGRLVVRDRQVLTLNPGMVMNAAEAWREKIRSLVPTRPF